MASTTAPKRTPVYFLSHGGPNIIYDTDHPVYPQLQAIGREITQVVKPKAVVVVSAHWESSIPGVVEINGGDGETALIYDFYGFPKHYYKHKYPNKASPSLAQHVSNLLSQSTPAIPARLTPRGLDHGVFASFSVAFPPSTSTSLFPNIPIVQVSLPFSSKNSDAYFNLGKALQPLRDEGVVVIASGMAVHNLRDLSFPLGGPRAYTVRFDEELRGAVEGSGSDVLGEGEGEGEKREERMKEVLKSKDLKMAHPSLEHLWPLYVAAGAGGGDKGKRIWTLGEGSMSWGMFTFGEV